MHTITKFRTRLAAIALVATGANAHHRAVVQGDARVLDGSRLQIEGQPIRLWGVDAPTNAWCENCGDKARRALTAIVTGKHVGCSNPQRLGFPESGRLNGDIVAECRLGHDAADQARKGGQTPKSVNMLLTAQGWALPTEPMHHTWLPLAKSIVKAAKKARSRRRGVWRHDFTVPPNAPLLALNPAHLGTPSGTIRGPATLRDDHRIAIGGRVLELAAIELADNAWCTGRRNRECGRKATRALKRLVARNPLTCVPVHPDTIPVAQRGTVTTAFCTAKQVERSGPCDRAECWINWQLVRAGHAVAKRSWYDLPAESRHPMTTLLAIAEEHAMVGPKGLWKSTLDLGTIDAEVDDRFVPAADGHNTVRGTATVIKPYIVDVDGHRLHLLGASPPQAGWCKGKANRRCRTEGRKRLEQLVDRREVRCTWLPHTPTLEPNHAVCHTDGDATSLAEHLLHDGWAFPTRHPTYRTRDRAFHHFRALYTDAKRGKRGMWAGRVRVPRDYPEEALIKGN